MASLNARQAGREKRDADDRSKEVRCGLIADRFGGGYVRPAPVSLDPYKQAALDAALAQFERAFSPEARARNFAKFASRQPAVVGGEVALEVAA